MIELKNIIKFAIVVRSTGGVPFYLKSEVLH